ncbi:MAG: hypothetical protein IKL04_02255 [Lachnospiraceae bacterium]|nr:hypothetical protein [Lachnospiraceae bacterium]
MFNKKNEIKEENTKYEELEVAEEFGDGWFAAGVATGIAIGVGVVIFT